VRGGWEWLAAGLAACHCVLPFPVLFGRDPRGIARRLGCVGAGILVVFLGDLFWLLAPATSLRADSGLAVHVLDLVLPGTIGGLWLALFFWHLDRRPPPPLQGVS
jgi:hypothetical protein